MEENVKKEKEVDVLDDFRKVEKAVRQKASASSMKLLKEKARAIMELKEESIGLLEALGIQEADMKRVIDFVNSLSDVQLSESDKKEIREKMREEGKRQKKRATEKIEELPPWFVGTHYPTHPPIDNNDTIKWTSIGPPQIVYGTTTSNTNISKSVGSSIETFCSTVN